MTNVIGPNAEQTRPKTKVLIAVATQDVCASSFAHDLARLVGRTAATARDEVELRLAMVKGSILPQQRQQSVRDALLKGCSHILFLDSDMRFPADALLRLLAHNTPIVGTNYSTRRMPLRPVAVVDGATGAELHPIPDAQGLIEVAWTGFGCMLVSLEVFRTMPLPWFMFGYDTDKHEYVGEDVMFFHAAKQHGFTPYVDPALSNEIGHLGEWEHTLEMTDALRQQDAREMTPTLVAG